MRTRHQWLKFWPSDWQNDAALSTCSIGARGLWISMICVMHEAETYGHMEVNGKPANTRQIAALARISEKEAARLIAELEDAGVFSRADDGSIYSRRMVRDWDYELKHKAWGKTGGNPDLIKTEPGTTHKNDRTKRLTPQKNPRLFRSVFEEAGGKCELCSVELTRDTPYAPNSYQLDHIVEIKHGGTNDRDNLRAVCRRCNMARNFKQRDDEPVNPYIGGAVKAASDGTDKFLDTEADSDSEPNGSAYSDPGGSAPGGAGPVDARSQLWSDGLGRLRSLTGKSDPQSRRFLGGLLKSAGDDCALVNAALAEAADLRPIDPAAWLTRRIRGPDSGQIRNGFLAIIAREGMPSTRPTEPNRFLTLENSDAIPH